MYGSATIASFPFQKCSATLLLISYWKKQRVTLRNKEVTVTLPPLQEIAPIFFFLCTVGWMSSNTIKHTVGNENNWTRGFIPTKNVHNVRKCFMKLHVMYIHRLHVEQTVLLCSNFSLLRNCLCTYWEKNNYRRKKSHSLKAQYREKWKWARRGRKEQF